MLATSSGQAVVGGKLCANALPISIAPIAVPAVARATARRVAVLPHFPKYLRLGTGWPFFAGIRKPSALRM